MWYDFTKYSDESLFGEESEQQIATDLLLKSVEDCEELYREAAIEAVSNKIYRQLVIDGKEEMAKKFAKKWGDYISVKEIQPKAEKDLKGKWKKYFLTSVTKKDLNNIWAEFRVRLEAEGNVGEYFRLKSNYEFKKPSEEVMSLETYCFIFEGCKREE